MKKMSVAANLLVVLTALVMAIPMNPAPVSAQSPGNRLHLPITVRNARPIVQTPMPIATSMPTPTPTPDGMARIAAAGRLTEVEPKDGPITEPVEISRVENPNKEIKYVTCNLQKWATSQMREIDDMVVFNPNAGILYPGALVRGADLEEGVYSPITIPRAGGDLTLTNLTLRNGDPNNRELRTYSRTVDEINHANVHEAIQSMLGSEVLGTASRSTFTASEMNSVEQMAFDLKTDLGMPFGSLKTSLNYSTETKKNHVYILFTQVYYDVTFADPELATSVFRDGEYFQDPESQIRPGSPPLYVQKVSYGRMVLFVAESDYSAKDVLASFQAAGGGFGYSLEVSGGLDYKEVMSRTTINYMPIGGSAPAALKVIDSANPNEMYDAVKSFIAQRDIASYSASTPGVPIAYTLRYLSDRSPARMSYSVTYDRKACKTELKAKATATVQFTKVDMIDDHDAWGHGSGDIKFRFNVNGTDVWYPEGANPEIADCTRNSCFVDMDDNTTHLIFNTQAIAEIYEDDNLVVSVTGYDDEGDQAKVIDDDYMGSASHTWKEDALWGAEAQKCTMGYCYVTNEHQLFSYERDGDEIHGNYRIYYKIDVQKLR